MSWRTSTLAATAASLLSAISFAAEPPFTKTYEFDGWVVRVTPAPPRRSIKTQHVEAAKPTLPVILPAAFQVDPARKMLPEFDRAEEPDPFSPPPRRPLFEPESDPEPTPVVPAEPTGEPADATQPANTPAESLLEELPSVAPVREPQPERPAPVTPEPADLPPLASPTETPDAPKPQKAPAPTPAFVPEEPAAPATIAPAQPDPAPVQPDPLNDQPAVPPRPEQPLEPAPDSPDLSLPSPAPVSREPGIPVTIQAAPAPSESPAPESRPLLSEDPVLLAELYREIYDALPYQAYESRHNPLIRHEMAMEILFGHFRPASPGAGKTVVIQNNTVPATPAWPVPSFYNTRGVYTRSLFRATHWP